MRTFFCIWSILTWFAVAPASATDLTKEQCDALIAKAIYAGNKVAGFNLLNSEAVKECFKQFPDLEKKYFPVQFGNSGKSQDPSFSVNWE